MRQLDLFGSFVESPSRESEPVEKTVVSKKNEEVSMLAEAVAPSYSKNALRSERLAADKTDEASIEKQETVTPVSPTASLLLSLFDSAGAETKLATQEIEVVLNQTPDETKIPEADKGPNVTELHQTEIAEEPEVAIIEEQIVTETTLLSEPVAEVTKKAATTKQKKQSLPELERNGAVIFDDGKISVKIKNKSPFPPPIAKEKKEKVKKVPQKRGRKSFKEIDAEVDLIEIPDDEILFQKQYYPISEVAKWFRVNTSLLRFWENEFDVLKPRKNRKGDRMFRPEDVKNLQLIYQLLRQSKYTIEGAKEYIKTNKKKADIQLQLTNTLQKFKSFLLDMKANLQS